MTEIRSKAQGKWRGILVALGVDEKFLTKKNGPCPMCGGKDRWRFTDFEQHGGWFCNHCGKGDGFELLKLMHGWDFVAAAREVEKIVGSITPERPPRSKQIFSAKRLAKIRAGLVREHPEVTAYLAKRGLQQPPTICAHPELGYFEDGKLIAKYPAMVAGVISPSGQTLSFHVTYLKNGAKAPVKTPRKLLTPTGKLDGAAIRLSGLASHIGIAEGIETALSAARLFRVHVWSVLSTTLMEKWTPPKVVERVTIFADADENYAGQKSAYALAFRLATAGIEVDVQVPKCMGQDFNDVLLARIREKAAA